MGRKLVRRRGFDIAIVECLAAANRSRSLFHGFELLVTETYGIASNSPSPSSPSSRPSGPGSVSLGGLLSRLAGGSQDAVAQIYDRCSGRLYRRLRQRYGYVGGPDPDDLLHDAFVLFLQQDRSVIERLVDRAASVGDGAVERYLWDLACGMASNRRRSPWARRRSALGEVERAGPDPGGERVSLARDSLAQLEDCLRGGRERIFLYFRLRFADGLTPTEIAQATGWSQKATYKLKQRLDEAVRGCAEALGLASGTS